MPKPSNKRDGGRPSLVHICSLGCPKNFVDTELAAASLLCEGFGFSNTIEDADIEFINTCAFVKDARDETEAAISAAEKWKRRKPSKRALVVGGCIVEWDKDGEFRKRHPDVDAWVHIDSASKLGELLKDSLGTDAAKAPVKSPVFLYDHSTPRLQLTPRHYAYIKIADGCDNHCSYCSIPSIRGRLRSRSTASVVEEAQCLLDGGVKELVLIAQDSSAFGRDRRYSGTPGGLAGLIDRLDKLEGDFWLRLMYLHPASVDPRLIESLAKARHLVPCLEMPLQHISDPVLKAMGRKSGSKETGKLIKRLREEIPGLALRTTFLLGFPGETEGDFERLKEFVIGQRFERLGAFAYSREPGTKAANMPCQIPSELAMERRDEIMRIQAGISLKANSGLAGKLLNVIVDDAPKGSSPARGRTFMDAPEIDNEVAIRKSKEARPGDFVRIMVDSFSEYEIGGTAIKD